MPVVDNSLTLCRPQHMYHGQPYARVNLNPVPESTLYPSQGLRIWPLSYSVDDPYILQSNSSLLRSLDDSGCCLPNLHKWSFKKDGKLFKLSHLNPEVQIVGGGVCSMHNAYFL